MAMQQPAIMLNHRQIAYLTAILLAGGGLLTIPHLAIELADVDAWFSIMLPLVYALWIAWTFAYLAGRFPGQNLFEIVMELTGPWVGRAINLVFLFGLWLILIRDIRLFSDTVQISLLPMTPMEMIMLGVMLVVLYYGNQGIETIARVNDLFFPLLVLLALCLPLFLANELSLEQMKPVLVQPVGSLLSASFFNMGWAGDLAVIGAFLHTMTVPRQVHASMRFGAIAGLLIVTVYLVLDIAVLGANVAAHSLFPQYTMIQEIHITDFLDRLEILIMSLWMPVFLIKSSVIYCAFAIGLASLVGSRNPVPWNKLLVWFLLLTTIASFRSITDVVNFGNYGASLVALPIEIPFFLLLTALAWRKKRVEDDGQGTRPRGDRRMQPSRNKGKLYDTSYRTWLRTTNLLLAAAIAFIAIGRLSGPYLPRIGTACGLLFAAVSVAVALTSHMELRKSANRTGSRQVDPEQSESAGGRPRDFP